MAEQVKSYPEYWGGKKLSYPNFPPESPKFSRSVVAGNLIFISGCQGQNDETITLETDVFEEQMIIALDKVRHAMEEAGSSMNNVIKTLMLLKHLEDYPAHAQDRAGVLPEARPDAGGGPAGEHLHVRGPREAGLPGRDRRGGGHIARLSSQSHSSMEHALA